MNKGYSRNDIILQRLNKAKECLAEAKWSAEGGFNNAAANRLYYACFNAVNALLFFRNMNAKSHSGVRSQFGLHFIETLIFPNEMV